MSSCATSQTTALHKSFLSSNLSSAANCPAIPPVLRNIEEIAGETIGWRGCPAIDGSARACATLAKTRIRRMARDFPAFLERFIYNDQCVMLD